MVLIVLIVAMGCGALAFRWLMADRGHVRYVDALVASRAAQVSASIGKPLGDQ